MFTGNCNCSKCEMIKHKQITQKITYVKCDDCDRLINSYNDANKSKCSTCIIKYEQANKHD